MTRELAAEGFPMTMLVADMCRLLNVHENTLYARIKAGQVPAFQRVGTGKRPRYEWRRSDVECWWANQRRYLRRSA